MGSVAPRKHHVPAGQLTHAASLVAFVVLLFMRGSCVILVECVRERQQFAVTHSTISRRCIVYLGAQAQHSRSRPGCAAGSRSRDGRRDLRLSWRLSYLSRLVVESSLARHRGRLLDDCHALCFVDADDAFLGGIARGICLLNS